MIRLGSRDETLLGHALARIRQVQGLSPAEQAAGLGMTLDQLAALSLCRRPQPGRREEDLAALSRHLGVGVEFLEWLLRATQAIGSETCSAE
jgi:hypothetical protein